LNGLLNTGLAVTYIQDLSRQRILLTAQLNTAQFQLNHIHSHCTCGATTTILTNHQLSFNALNFKLPIPSINNSNANPTITSFSNFIPLSNASMPSTLSTISPHISSIHEQHGDENGKHGNSIMSSSSSSSSSSALKELNHSTDNYNKNSIQSHKEKSMELKSHHDNNNNIIVKMNSIEQNGNDNELSDRILEEFSDASGMNMFLGRLFFIFLRLCLQSISVINNPFFFHSFSIFFFFRFF